ncbi:Rha family transcriptional regulator [Pseudomonas sp. Ld6]|uniref:Rha family transcriptional regulator n=1 Tax=Pseudomonas sp. Ld6 TaxID=649167 RepID=UPI003865517F
MMVTSRQIAEQFGKRHDHVLRDIKKLISQVSDFRVVASSYTDRTGRRLLQYELDGDEASLMIARYQGLARVPLSLQERAALAAVEQVLGVTLIRQYRVGTYRIDGYDPVNQVAYEVDEPEHRHQIAQDAVRQAVIERELSCRFVRIAL